MRVKYMKESPEILAGSSIVEDSPQDLAGRWKAFFGSEKLALEIGCGMGAFLRENAIRTPSVGWIGLERIGTVLAKAVLRWERQSEEGDVPNFRLIRGEARDLETFFAPGEVDRIYLNFSDPWPKTHHAKRRLTSDRFLPLYRYLLSSEGELEMKTDNAQLFAFSLDSLTEDGWKILVQTDDLHHSELAEGNVMTEYEQRFVSQGLPIHYLRAVPGPKPDQD